MVMHYHNLLAHDYSLPQSSQRHDLEVDGTVDACPREEALVAKLFHSALQRTPVVEVVVEPATADAAATDALANSNL